MEVFFDLVSKTYARLDEDQVLLAQKTKEKEKIEKKMREYAESLKRYQDLVNNLSVGVYRNTLGHNGRFLEANPAIISLFEADSKKEFMKHSMSDLYQDPTKRAVFVKKILKFGFVKDEELDLVTLKGKKLICSVSAVMKKGEDGSIYIDGLIDDITEHKKTEEALKNARDELEIKVKERTQTLQKTNNELSIEINQRKQIESTLKQINRELEDSKKAIGNVLDDLHLEKTNTEKEKAKDEAILASIADGCVAVDENGEIILINQMAQKMLGYTSKDSLGKQWYEILRREDESGNPISPENGAIGAALSSAAITNTIAAFYYLRKDGTKIPISRTVSPITLQGKTIGAINIFRDITREREIDKAKTEFISIASHQLRTPMTTVSWYAEMLLAGDTGKINPEQKKYLNEILRGSQRMVELVNALLNVARLELGTFVIEPEPTDVVKLTKSVIDEHKTQINSKKIIFSSSFEKDIPAIPADPKLLRMVVQNILSNAVKYTPENGKIKLSVFLDNSSSRKTTDGQNKKNILLKISDTGYGIPKKQQSRIFTKLFRADNVRRKDNNGTGLGLYIVKSIIEHSGGSVWFESPSSIAFDKTMAGKKENKGTTFYVTVPLEGMKRKKGAKILA